MASGHVNRTQRPNTWLHRPTLRREDSPCQLGAVHTWPSADIPRQRRRIRFSRQSGHRATVAYRARSHEFLSSYGMTRIASLTRASSSTANNGMNQARPRRFPRLRRGRHCRRDRRVRALAPHRRGTPIYGAVPLPCRENPFFFSPFRPSVL